MDNSTFSHNALVCFVAMCYAVHFTDAIALADGWGEIRGRLVASPDSGVWNRHDRIPTSRAPSKPTPRATLLLPLANAFVFLLKPRAIHREMLQGDSLNKNIEDQFRERNGFPLFELQQRIKEKKAALESLALPPTTLECLGSGFSPRALILQLRCPLVLVNRSSTDGHAFHVRGFRSYDEWFYLKSGEATVYWVNKGNNWTAGMANIVCGIHPQGVCDIQVADHPYVAITDEQGDFVLSKVPAGQCQLMARRYTSFIHLGDGMTGSKRAIQPTTIVIEAGNTYDFGNVRVR